MSNDDNDDSTFASIKEIFDNFRILYLKKYDAHETLILDLFNGKTNMSNLQTSDLECPEILNMLGLYSYYMSGEFEIKYFQKGIELGCVESNIFLGVYYHNDTSEHHSSASAQLCEKYLMDAYNSGAISASYNLGFYYKRIKDFPNMIKYFLVSIDLESKESMYELGKYYKKCTNNNTDAIHYLKRAENLGHVGAMNLLAAHYRDIKDYDQMIIYLTKIIKLCNEKMMIKSFFRSRFILGTMEASLQLGNYYKSINEHNISNEYYLEALKLGSAHAYGLLSNGKSPVELYCLLHKINDNKFAIKKIEELKKDVDVLNYINRIKISEQYKIIELCLVCYEIRLNIIAYKCSHLICYECYLHTKICPICRSD